MGWNFLGSQEIIMVCILKSCPGICTAEEMILYLLWHRALNKVYMHRITVRRLQKPKLHLGYQRRQREGAHKVLDSIVLIPNMNIHWASLKSLKYSQLFSCHINSLCCLVLQYSDSYFPFIVDTFHLTWIKWSWIWLHKKFQYSCHNQIWM